MATYEKSFLLSLYRDMVRIRAFEEHAAECFTKGMLAGNIHLSIGQEAAEAGAFAAIEPRDYFTSTHRGHGHAIARGADPKRAMAELFGKAAGYCKGKGGSMHIADMEKMNHLGANGIVGAGQPISAGSALASKIMGDDSVTVGCFGDGSTNEGSFHESLNMAAAWKLPLVWFIENNCYGVSTEIHRVTNTPDLASRAAAYGVPYAVVDGTDAIAVYEAMKVALDHARSGKGPYVVEAKVYRYQGHGGLPPQGVHGARPGKRRHREAGAAAAGERRRPGGAGRHPAGRRGRDGRGCEVRGCVPISGPRDGAG